MVIDNYFIDDNTPMKMTAIENDRGTPKLHVETISMNLKLTFAVECPEADEEPNAVKKLWIAFIARYPNIHPMQGMICIYKGGRVVTLCDGVVVRLGELDGLTS